MEREEIRWIVVPVTNGMTLEAQEEDRKKEAKAEAKAKASKNAAATKERPDGTAVEKNAENERDVLPEKTKRPAEKRNAFRPSNSKGLHWGLMIIDKQRDDARWLDGALTLRTRNKKTRIHHMFGARWVAGKVLCGYDKVMGRERGLFTATTLKHVTHDRHYNRFKGDRGCVRSVDLRHARLHTQEPAVPQQ